MHPKTLAITNILPNHFFRMNTLNFLFSKKFLRHLLIALVVLLVLGFITLQLLKIITHHNRSVQVPNLSGKSLYEARELIEDLHLRFEVIDSTDYDPKFSAYSVMGQDPAPGTKVKKRRKLYLTLNPSGYRKVMVPNVIQVTRRNAELLIKAVGLQVGTISYVNDIGKDMVLSITYKGKEIQPGEPLPRASKLNLVCGNGLSADEPAEEPQQEPQQGTENDAPRGE